PTLSLAVVAEGKLLAESDRKLTSHCSGLPIAVEELLAGVGLKIDDVRGVAVGLGPGSFTGLRIGLSYAKGMAYAGGIEIVGIPSLDAIALSAVCVGAAPRGRPSEGDRVAAPLQERAEPDTLICPLLDARKGEVYT